MEQWNFAIKTPSNIYQDKSFLYLNVYIASMMFNKFFLKLPMKMARKIKLIYKLNKVFPGSNQRQ